MESVEASGRSIEDAILQALVRLGRRRDEVDVTVLQEPSRGSRDMGAREARVRVSLKTSRRRTAAVVTPEMADALLPPSAEEYEAEPSEQPDEGAAGNEPFDEEYGDELYEEEYEEELEEDGMAPDLVEAPVAALRELLGPEATVEEVAVEALRAILAHMGFGNTLIEVRDREPLTLNVQSAGDEDLSQLIGRRGDTLASLQLIVALIVSKQTGQRERIVVDAEGYRERREDNLRSLAQRVAQQVRRVQSPVTLEAMPPSERRIVHMALADEEDITTESVGEGDQRRVVIALKHPQVR
ncbi:MAG TPA: RNA-binding cell elongation regulator Jag/EloR [Ktedonobacterales bacterium]